MRDFESVTLKVSAVLCCAVLRYGVVRHLRRECRGRNTRDTRGAVECRQQHTCGIWKKRGRGSRRGVGLGGESGNAVT